jgi:hypothetical protein
LQVRRSKTSSSAFQSHTLDINNPFPLDIHSLPYKSQKHHAPENYNEPSSLSLNEKQETPNHETIPDPTLKTEDEEEEYRGKKN